MFRQRRTGRGRESQLQDSRGQQQKVARGQSPGENAERRDWQDFVAPPDSPFAIADDAAGQSEGCASQNRDGQQFAHVER